MGQRLGGAGGALSMRGEQCVRLDGGEVPSRLQGQ